MEAASIDARESAQRVADMLAAVLHAGVEVVDRDLVRLASSGTTAGRSSTPPEPALYVACMRTRLPAWTEAAAPGRPGPVVACPIVAGGDALGAIGLVPVLAGQAESLRAHPREVTDLVTAVSEPLRGAAGWQALPPAAGRIERMETAVLDSLPDGVLAVDPHGRVLYCSRAALAMLRAEVDLTGQVLEHWYAPAETLGDLSAAQTRDVAFERHGHRFRFLETSCPLRGGGRVTGVLIVLRDAGAGRSAVRPSPPTLVDAERQLIDDALERYGTSGVGKRRAARALGISLSTLYRKLRRRPARSRRCGS
ncbi:MAG: PAS domain-containing protein [bacterium]